MCAWPDDIHDTQSLQAIIPDVMWGSGEFQGGAFDPWGGVSVLLEVLQAVIDVKRGLVRLR